MSYGAPLGDPIESHRKSLKQSALSIKLFRDVIFKDLHDFNAARHRNNIPDSATMHHRLTPPNTSEPQYFCLLDFQPKCYN